MANPTVQAKIALDKEVIELTEIILSNNAELLKEAALQLDEATDHAPPPQGAVAMTSDLEYITDEELDTMISLAFSQAPPEGKFDLNTFIPLEDHQE